MSNNTVYGTEQLFNKILDKHNNYLKDLDWNAKHTNLGPQLNR